MSRPSASSSGLLRGRGVTAVLGPTNTGKTHLAIERLLAHDVGIIGLPLRLLAREVYEDLRTRMSAEYDSGGHIGKRYRRQDEIGTPFAVTIDHQSVEDHTVTLRQRDSLQQDRIAIADLAGELEERIR